jgi:hypothetical protein
MLSVQTSIHSRLSTAKQQEFPTIAVLPQQPAVHSRLSTARQQNAFGGGHRQHESHLGSAGGERGAAHGAEMDMDFGADACAGTAFRDRSAGHGANAFGAGAGGSAFGHRAQGFGQDFGQQSRLPLGSRVSSLAQHAVGSNAFQADKGTNAFQAAAGASGFQVHGLGQAGMAAPSGNAFGGRAPQVQVCPDIFCLGIPDNTCRIALGT